MNESFHGHDVMQMMSDADRGYTRESLLAAIETRFGATARFHTCSAEGMTGAELLDFLLARGKVVEADDGLRFGGHTCGHEHEHKH
ncbi:MAG: YecH family protein [Oligoflexia bacterium]|nr:YecH family protein [Oligoflexia bacterium]